MKYDRWSSFGLAACILFAAVPDCHAGSESIGASVREAVAATGLKKAALAVSIREASTGRSIVSVRGGEALAPASNMKVLTTAAAITVLGPDFAFSTRMLLDGDRLTIVGDGDPALGDPALLAESTFTDASGKVHSGLDIERLLDTWVASLRAAGVKRLREIVVDDRIFAREGAHPSWPKDQLNERYCAPPFGLNFHANSIGVSVAPRAGAAPEITTITPKAPWMAITNKGTSRTGKNDKNTLWFARTPETGDLTLYGNVKTKLESPILVPVGDPSLFLAQCLAHRLRAAGVSVTSARIATAADATPAGKPIGPVLRTPITTVLEHCNFESDNLYAECLLKRIAFAKTGTAGSWALGARAMQGELQARIGRASDAFVVSDGSGLSRENRVTADGMTLWLASVAQDERIASRFIETLPVAGQSGTVRKRMKEINPAVALVQCKSGYIDKVCCLSGYVTASDGTRLAFSVLANGLSEAGAVGKAKKLQDRICAILAEELAARRSALGG
ncbi:MAG: D-alanyl-D-alanine carboxypeptidase/D-alanyl-D-alanine-endopeptidase [Planctomycetes bacterium]|nr:D-alanyl-D-alanine carboxypeptidase/D-alanyl-D-alanine-endopeptidase [Planctomycetota bacterium]